MKTTQRLDPLLATYTPKASAPKTRLEVFGGLRYLKGNKLRERGGSMKIKASELEGTALDWAVCKTAGFLEAKDWQAKPKSFSREWRRTLHRDEQGPTHPSTSWANGGPIIEDDTIELRRYEGGWLATSRRLTFRQGGTPLIAAMRCYVAVHLGDEVDIPEEITA